MSKPKRLRHTGQSTQQTGIYTCSGECGTMIKMKAGEPMPWCAYCLDRVDWRLLSAGPPIARVTETRDWTKANAI